MTESLEPQAQAIKDSAEPRLNEDFGTWLEPHYKQTLDEMLDKLSDFKKETKEYLNATSWENGKVARILRYTEKLIEALIKE